MARWTIKHKVALALNGEVGFGRPCVGILVEGKFPDYHWYDEKTYEDIDPNGDVWTPEDAYHKHTCVAVLGTGEEAERQLYEWLRWFDDNDFVLKVGDVDLGPDRGANLIKCLMGQHRYARMVRRVEKDQ